MPEKLYFELPTDKWDVELPENSPLNYEVEVDSYKWESDTAVIIIVGKWWTTEWYENKYVTIANNLVKDHWVNVFVIENPWISWDDPELFVSPDNNKKLADIKNFIELVLAKGIK